MVFAKNFSVGQSNVVACIWDFDKTLSPNYTQQALFDHYGLDLENFWEEVNVLPEKYLARGIKVSEDNVWQSHLLSYVKAGLLPGLTNKKLREIGKNVQFFDGLPDFFLKMKNFVAENYEKNAILLEHYIVSSGIAEVIRGSHIAQYVDGIFACEFIEDPIVPGFLDAKNDKTNTDSAVDHRKEISQIAFIVDNTHKTQCIFEINKGCNKNSKICINATIDKSNRRIPVENMIYIADGPSDIPAFTVIRREGGLAYAVYNPKSDAEFEQNDRMLANGRVDAYGPADYSDGSPTVRWLKMHIKLICDRICREQDEAARKIIGEAPIHIH